MGNMIKIKGMPIGLFGLELAVSTVKNQMEKEGLSINEAAERLLDILKKKNYIPDSRKDDYLKALRDLLSERPREGEGIIIRILGPGCVGCNKLEKVVLEVLSEHNIPADIYHVTDKDEILRYDVTRTPALVINDEVKSAGKIPSKAQVEKWLLGI